MMARAAWPAPSTCDAVEAENYFDHLEMEELVVYEGILRMR